MARNGKSFDRDEGIGRSESQRLSMRRSISRGSSSSRRSYTFSFGLPDPIGINGVEEKGENSIRNEMISPEEHQKISLKRLAYMNKPELPVLLFGSVAAVIQGVLYPIFSVVLSNSINMFYENHHKLRKDARFSALMFVGMGFIFFVASPVQNFLFGVAGGKLVQRIRSSTFEKVVHQEISWFDDPENSRSVKVEPNFDLL